MPSIVGRALLIDKLVMNPGLSYVRITTSYMKGQSEIAYLPKFANMYILLIVLVIVITE